MSGKKIEVAAPKPGVVQRDGDVVVMDAASWETIAEAVEAGRRHKRLDAFVEKVLLGMRFP
jgi:hypothetical protein